MDQSGDTTDYHLVESARTEGSPGNSQTIRSSSMDPHGGEGGTARAGGSGNVISLVQNPQKKKWSTIQKEVGLNIKFSTPEFKDLIQHEDISHILPPRRGGRNSRQRKDRRGRPNDGGNRKSSKNT